MSRALSLLVFIAFAGACCAASCSASRSDLASTSASETEETTVTHKYEFEFEATGYEVKADEGIVRIEGNLYGLPHTSNRIDSITLHLRGVQFGATDIDGVDLKRYFQWEDDGIIPMEIDFPVPAAKFVPDKDTSIDFHTVNGLFTNSFKLFLLNDF